MKTKLLLFGTLLCSNIFAQTPKSYTVLRTSTPIVIDAIMNGWQGAKISEDMSICTTGKYGNSGGNFRMLWDDNNLYIFFHMEDASIKTSAQAQDAFLWQLGDVVEMIFDFDGNGHHYLEMGINPDGSNYDFNMLCTTPACGGWNDDKAWDIANMEISTKIYRSADNFFDYGFDVEVKIPFSSFNNMTGSNFQMPTNGTVWKGNMMMVDYNVSSSSPNEYNSWSTYPAGAPAFHQPNYFGSFIFSDLSVSTNEITSNASSLNLTRSQNHDFIVNGNETILVKIFDLSGKLILSNTVANNESINISHLEQGMYIVNLQDKTSMQNFKIMK
jgi:hypothetical protein